MSLDFAKGWTSSPFKFFLVLFGAAAAMGFLTTAFFARGHGFYYHFNHALEYICILLGLVAFLDVGSLGASVERLEKRIEQLERLGKV